MPLPNVKHLCGAHSRRTGEPCKNPANRWTGRCRMHGGNCDWFGSANVSYWHGQYCRFSVDKLIGGMTRMRTGTLPSASVSMRIARCG